MKHIDVTKPVMNTIVRYEKMRTGGWIKKFLFALSVLIVILIVLITIIIVTLAQQQTFDLLQVLTEDQEVIREYWQDTVITFWEESPQVAIGIGFVVLLTLIGLVMITRKKRDILRKKMNTISRYDTDSL